MTFGTVLSLLGVLAKDLQTLEKGLLPSFISDEMMLATLLAHVKADVDAWGTATPADQEKMANDATNEAMNDLEAMGVPMPAVEASRVVLLAAISFLFAAWSQVKTFRGPSGGGTIPANAPGTPGGT